MQNSVWVYARSVGYHKAVPAKIIHVATLPAGYDISLGTGLLAGLHGRLAKLMRPRPYRVFVITSPRIWRLWSETFLASFPSDRQPVVLMLPAGEQHKKLPVVERLAEQLARAGADRDALLIAFGGGVVGDVTGFLAAIYMRGVPFVQVPTTLLAQVDSSVGGKTGVNLVAGKNLIGSFHQPRAVFVDFDLLRTLPPRELRAGLQESIKAGIIQDLKLFGYLEAQKELVMAMNVSVLARIVGASIEVKARVVEQDEREAGPRMTLNFGHTLGHAIEAAAGYGRLLHGEAVAWGMIGALHLGLARKTITEEEFARMANLILAYGPLPGFKATARRLVALTGSDKKNRGGYRVFVLPQGIGSTRIVRDVTDEELTHAAQAMIDDMLTTSTTSGRVWA